MDGELDLDRDRDRDHDLDLDRDSPEEEKDLDLPRCFRFGDGDRPLNGVVDRFLKLGDTLLLTGEAVRFFFPTGVADLRWPLSRSRLPSSWSELTSFLLPWLMPVMEASWSSSFLKPFSHSTSATTSFSPVTAMPFWALSSTITVCVALSCSTPSFHSPSKLLEGESGAIPDPQNWNSLQLP